MKRLIVLLVAALLVIGGCAPATPPPQVPAPAPTAAPAGAPPPAAPTAVPAAAPAAPAAQPPAAPTSPPRRVDQVTVAVVYLDESFLPAEGSGGRRRYYGAVYDPLVEFDYDRWMQKPGDWAVKPALLTKWEFSPDRRRMTFTVRQGVQFQDGWGELTAEDVVFHINEARSNPKAYVSPAWTGMGLQARTLGRFEGEVTASTPGEFLSEEWFLFDLGNQFDYVPSKAYIEKVGRQQANLKPIGSGPFRWVSTRPNELIFEAVDNHWRVTPQFKRLRLIKVPEGATRLAMVRSGEAQLADAGAEEVKEAQGAGLKAFSLPNTVTLWGLFGGLILDPATGIYNAQRHGKDPWADVRVRKAMNLALDRQAILKALAPLGSSLVPTGLPFREGAGFPVYPYDPEQAKRLLAEAGYKDGFKFSIASHPRGDAPENEKVLEAMAGYWSAVGLRPAIQPVDQLQWVARWRAKEVDTGGFIWNSSASTKPGGWQDLRDYFLPPESGGGPNFTFVDPELSKILAELRQTRADPEKARPLEARVARYLYDNHAVIPLYASGSLWVGSSKITEWKTAPDIRHYEYIKINP